MKAYPAGLTWLAPVKWGLVRHHRRGGSEPQVATTIRRAREHHDRTASASRRRSWYTRSLATIYSPVGSPAVSRNQTPDMRNRAGRPTSRGFDQHDYDDEIQGRSRTYSGALKLGNNKGQGQGEGEGGLDRAAPLGQVGAGGISSDGSGSGRKRDGAGGGGGGGGIGGTGGGAGGSVGGGSHDSISESLAFLSMSGAEHESRSLVEDDAQFEKIERYARLAESGGASSSRNVPILLPSTSLTQSVEVGGGRGVDPAPAPIKGAGAEARAGAGE